MPVAIPLASLAITAASTGYSMHEQKKAEEDAAANQPKAPADPTPEGATNTAADVAAAQKQSNVIQAGSAAFAPNIGNAPNAQKKSLLGTA